MNKKRIKVQFLAKKSLKEESKSDKISNGDLAHKRVCRYSWSANKHMASADWPKCSARLGSHLIDIKPIFFDFLEIRTLSNSYLISFSLFFKHPNLYK